MRYIFWNRVLFWFSVVQELGYLHERTYIEAQMQRILEPWRKGRKDEECGNGNCGRPHQGTRKIVAGRFICQVVLEWNPGGHFADSGKRLAKGIKWLMEKRY